jgi:hypothetical protein
VFPKETQAMTPIFIESKTETHLSDARFAGKAVKVSSLHQVRDFSLGFFDDALGIFGPLGGLDYCNWNIASLQNKIIFWSKHAAHFGALPFCQAEWFGCFLGYESVWTIILNRNVQRWHIPSIVDANTYTQISRPLRWIRGERRVVEIDKGAVSQLRSLIRLFQNIRLNDENRRSYQSNYYQPSRPIADYSGPFGYFFIGVGFIVVGWWVVGRAFRHDNWVAFSGFHCCFLLGPARRLLPGAFNNSAINSLQSPLRKYRY